MRIRLRATGRMPLLKDNDKATTIKIKPFRPASGTSRIIAENMKLPLF